MLLPALTGLTVYEFLGGAVPIPSLRFVDLSLSILGILVHFLLFVLAYSGFIGYVIWVQKNLTSEASRKPIINFLAMALGFPFLAYPFGILAAGIFVQNGTVSFLFFSAGISLVSILARQLSLAAESSRQQTRQLVHLEQLSRDIINGPPDATGLPDLLRKHVPVMFPSGRVIIWVENKEFLLRHPRDWYPGVERFWEWIRNYYEPAAFLAEDDIPWRNEQLTHSPIVTAPILDIENHQPVGGIYIELQTLVQPWTRQTVQRLFPAVNSLAAQIASALRQAEVYYEALEVQRTMQELQVAQEIQASFFPDQIPMMSGWELAVTLLPAREMAGDFFDFIQMEDNRLGILIADVTDKGIGPALYMALSRTLIRTYALEYEFEPDTVFFAANGRILKDARAALFVTAFFGILECRPQLALPRAP
jgi:hypothetical protein